MARSTKAPGPEHDDGSVTFAAALPPILSAIKCGDDGARIQFDVPESDKAAVKRLMDWHHRELRVTVALA